MRKCSSSLSLLSHELIDISSAHINPLISMSNSHVNTFIDISLKTFQERCNAILINFFSNANLWMKKCQS